MHNTLCIYKIHIINTNTTKILILIVLSFLLYLSVTNNIFIALFSCIPNGLAIWMFFKSRLSLNETYIIENSLSPRFIDGKRVAVTGKAYATDGNPLRSPCLEEQCVYYQYNIYTKMYNTDYWGMRLIPIHIVGENFKVKLLGFPYLSEHNKSVYEFNDDNKEIYKNMYRYLSQTEFKHESNLSLIDTQSLLPDKATILNNRIKEDYRTNDRGFDLRAKTIEEQYLGEGEEICVVGVWDQKHEGIISDTDNKAITTYNMESKREIDMQRSIAKRNQKLSIGGFICTNLVLILIVLL